MKTDIQKLTNFRHTLHKNAEVSGNENRTAVLVENYIRDCKPTSMITQLGGTGILATWDSGAPGKSLLIRSELDALPITEVNTFNYISETDGVSHKCGHDGHSTILCAVAEYLNNNNPVSGKVHLLFQPAEETGAGAEAVLADKLFDKAEADFAVALHNLPGYPLNEVVVKENTFTAAVTSIIIYLQGKTAHAGEPENGINPALAIAQIISEGLALENNNPEDDNMSVITPVFIEMGEKAYGISAGEGEVHLTVRCWNDENLDKLCKAIESLSGDIAQKYKLKYSFEYTQTFHANINEHEITELVRRSADQNKLHKTEKTYPFKWGEDFGLFTSRFKGCMFGIGSGENCPALHNPDYDFPDELILSGSNMFIGIIHELGICK